LCRPSRLAPVTFGVISHHLAGGHSGVGTERAHDPRFPWTVDLFPPRAVLGCVRFRDGVEVPDSLGFSDAPVAQLDRVSPSEGEGHRFESCRVRQLQ
jgi:hypothetical protein